MSTVLVRRPPRRPAPEIPGGELRVEAPPELPRAAGGRWQQLLMLLPMLGGGVAMAMMMGRGGGAFSYVVGGMFGISSLAMLATTWGYGGPRKAELVAARRDYLRHLSLLRGQARATVARQRTGLFYRHPDPERLWSTVDSHRLWERRPADTDFAVVRVGVGPQTLATTARPAGDPAARRPGADDGRRAAPLPRRVLGGPDLPVALSMRGFARVHAARLAGAPGPRDAGPAGHLPRTRRPGAGRRRRPRPPRTLGVGQVAAARPASRPVRRTRRGPAGRRHGGRAGALLDRDSPRPARRSARGVCSTARLPVPPGSAPAPTG